MCSFKIGDVVRITLGGGLYETYEYALRHFNVPNIKNYIDFLGNKCIRLNVPSDFKEQNWVIVDKAIHCGLVKLENCKESDILYCLENSRKERIISNSKYFIKRPNVKTTYTERLKKLNENKTLIRLKVK